MDKDGVVRFLALSKAPVCRAGAQSVLQSREDRAALLVQHRDLAVEIGPYRRSVKVVAGARNHLYRTSVITLSRR